MIARINRRETITLLSGTAAWPLAARAQQGRLPVVGVLGAVGRGTSAPLARG